MASRKTIRINFMGISSLLKELVSEIPDHAQFIKRHGYLLDLVISGFEEDMMHDLFQFFDPKLHSLGTLSQMGASSSSKPHDAIYTRVTVIMEPVAIGDVPYT